MSCSARLPVYTLLIAACFPGSWLQATMVMLSMYLLGIVMALAMAWLFKKTLLKGRPPLLIMELPPYKMPGLKTILRHMWDRSKIFLRRAGTVILGINIILWFLATYPKSPAIEKKYADERAALQKATSNTENFAGVEMAEGVGEVTTGRLKEMETLEAGEKLKNSFAGRLGKLIEPMIKPLGFDWKMGIGIVTSFAAREVFVSTMSIVYNVGEADDEAHKTLAETLRSQKREDGSGRPVYTQLTSISLMVFYVLALQCVSTVAVVRRETNSWKWPIFQWVYMGILAWIMAFITYQGGKMLGFT
jgi:ferrous iron transport protein B